MKNSVLRLLSLLLALAPIPTLAQSNIKAALDAIINCSDADVTANHALEKDPDTGIKSGQDDIYNFIMPAGKIGLIKKALAAFDKDIPKAYSVKSGKNKGKSSSVLLHSELTGSNGISIDKPGFDYIYALFLPSKSEDPEGKYRYAYAIAYKEEKGEIHGKIVINYATTLKHRQNTQGQIFQWNDGSATRISDNGNIIITRSADSDPEQQTWFGKVMACVNGMSDASHKTRLALATKAYTIIRDVKQYPEVTAQDKSALREIFRAMRLDKQKYSDSTLSALLLQCENAIK